MSKNIKEIGKELLGKSLNSYHRRTGLIQLEKNNEMQDGILNGILSQVDDAYIEKTEQSNVIHLEGSGDGTVVVDNIEGNTMVNIHSKQVPTFHIGGLDTNSYNIITNSNYIKVTLNDGLVFSYRYICMGYLNLNMFKPNTTYTLIFSKLKGVKNIYFMDGNATNKLVLEPIKAIDNQLIYRFTTGSSFVESSQVLYLGIDSSLTTLEIEAENPMIFEGDYTNKLVSQKYFEGLQSSFEEKVNDEGKYEIEILSQNENLWDGSYEVGSLDVSTGEMNNNGSNRKRSNYIKIEPNKSYSFRINDFVSYPNSSINLHLYDANKKCIKWKDTDVNANYYIINNNKFTFTTPNNAKYLRFRTEDNRNLTSTSITLTLGTNLKGNIPQKQNKIKLLINEPLRALSNDTKDKLCVKDNKLTVKRNCGELALNSNSDIEMWNSRGNCIDFRISVQDIKHSCKMLSDKFTYLSWNTNDVECCTVGGSPHIYVRILKSKLSEVTVQGFKTWLQSNPVKIVYELAEPYYEEVINEYGEPVVLEGYENGTVYIDSTIVPTTTVRYTPKMESLKTLKAVNDNNIMLTDDINNNIIDYMMNVDLMIMEKEMENKKIRRIGEKDMTNMQKRTFDMLKRLIKGKTLTEQECKDRVVLYLSAEKITSEQAEELMLYISEIYF